MSYACFKADKDIMDAFVRLREKKGRGGGGGATAGEPALATSLWGMLYTDDAGVVSQSPEQLSEEGGGRERGCVGGVWSHRVGVQD